MLKRKLQKKYFVRQVGFTLIELLISISIIGLLTVLVLADYRSGQKKYALKQNTQKLVSDIRKAQNMAMSGVDIESQYCGYGIELNQSARPDSYRFYADKSSNCQTSNNKYDGSDDILETIDLSDRIEIQSTSPSPIDIFFKPPIPTVYINGQDEAGGVSSGVITLKLKDTSLTKVITIYVSGLIESN